MSAKRHTITAALPYANGPLHLGHIAGVYVPADIYARYLRLKQEDVAFICGSDEHGAAITLRAKKEGILPKDIVDQYHAINKKAFSELGISFDIYYRTTEQLHYKTAQDFFLKLHDSGALEERESEQYFDEEHQQFLADRYIKGTCPNCGYEHAEGDSCERCGTNLSPLELIDPVSTLSGKKPVLKKTAHWYLPMNRHEDWLRSWIKDGMLDGVQVHDSKVWRNQVVGQCMSWIDGGLQPRAMTRDLDWGVPVPLKDAEGKVLYVWLDAPIGYISATKAWAAEQGKDWQDYWQNPDTELIHFLAKDNIVFHCIIFPILLREHGGYILPKNVPANEFLNLEGNKFSTSRNWAVWLHEYLEDFPGKQDVLRYVLCSIAPESKDSEFTWRDFQARNNNELADIYGNFMHRVLVLSQKYYQGIVPARGELTDLDQQVLEQIPAIVKRLDAALKAFKFREALTEAMNIAREGNRYFAATEPWKIFKTDPDRVATIMNIAIQIAANLSIAFEPFMPFSSQKIREMMNLPDPVWSNLGNMNVVATDHQLGKSEVLFSKFDDELIEAQRAKLTSPEEQETNSNYPPMKETISFDDFTKLDVRIGKILSAEKHPNANKLLVLKVDTGLDERTVVSGIAAHYSPEEVIGKQVSLLMNLAPRKIRGIESQGMILMAEDASGVLTFVAPDQEVDTGAVVQ